MFEISPGKIKNSIQKLEELQKTLAKSRDRLQAVYACMDSLVDGQMDKQAIRILAEQAEGERKSAEQMTEALQQIMQEYEKTEKKILQEGQQIKGRLQLNQIDLTEITRTLTELGIRFE